MKTFGTFIRELRIEQSLTVDQLAKAVSTNKGYISGIENDRVSPPSEKFLRKFARILRVSHEGLSVLAHVTKAPRHVRERFEKQLEPTILQLEPKYARVFGAEAQTEGVAP